MTRNPRRAAIYARISQDTEGAEVGVSNQVASARALAQDHGLEVVATYQDNDTGASSLSKKARPDFAALIAAAARGEFEVILAYSMSRLTRRPAEWETLITLAQTHKIEFIYRVSPRYDLNTADGRATARTVAAWDAAEAERTGERVRMAKTAALAKGKDLGGPRPFGWEPSRREHRPAEAEAIRSAAAAILAGASVSSVAKAWTAAGIAPPRAGRPSRNGGTASHQWRPQAVRHILSNPRQIGRMVVKGVDYGRVAEPILTDHDHAALLAIFANPARKPKRGPEPLTSTAQQLVKCGTCGGSMSAGYSRGYRSIRCADASYRPGPHPVIALTIAEAQLGAAALWALTFQQPKEIESVTPEVATLQVKIADDKAKLERVTAAFIGGIGDLDYLGRESVTLKGAIADAQSRLDALLAHSDSAGAVAVARQFVTGWGEGASLIEISPEKAFGGAWGEYWQSLEIPARRRLLRGLFRDIRTVAADDSDPGRFIYDGVRLHVSAAEPRPFDLSNLNPDDAF
ncbi:recombinase family protein [Microbacterium murale]|uniref:Site-specific DNA recombinase n=1 Tax=Microbacterium murale TaxID=1081040 RepID=A0ABU0PE98_9MICO|nr:recombinase family protein [Microbacterium murale]MDQ0645648.1 site-specific DNA recombinase [Microbacterium murale]